MPSIVWDRARYTRKVTETGVETLVVMRDPVYGPNGASNQYFEIMAKRHKDLEILQAPRMEPMRFPPTVADIVRRNSQTHEKVAEHGVKELFGRHTGEICILAGSGRSLLKDLDTIRGRDRSRVKVIAINHALKPVGPEHVDYYFILDWMSRKEWWKGLDARKVPCVTSSSTPPYVIGAFPLRYYFGGMLAACSDETEDMKQERKWVSFGLLEQGFIASFSAMHLAYKMGFKRIVLSGHDFAYTDMWYHWDEKVTMERAEQLGAYVHQDIYGKMTVSDDKLLRGNHMVNAASILLEESGVECVNASQEGILAMERRADLKDCLGDKCPPRLIKPKEIPIQHCLGPQMIEVIDLAA